MTTTQPTERMPRSDAMRLTLSDTLHLEGLELHPDDRAVLEAWARHELTGEEAIERLHELLDAQVHALTAEDLQTRALAAFPTLRSAELLCYGLDQLPAPTKPPRLAARFPPLTREQRKVYREDELPEDYDGYMTCVPLEATQEEIDQLPDYCFQGPQQRVVRVPASYFKIFRRDPDLQDPSGNDESRGL